MDKVKLMTIHKSKGLEFPVVFCIGVDKNILPHEKSTDIEEERRICYVGISRAKDELYVSWTHFYNNKETGSSIFIKDMINKSKIDRCNFIANEQRKDSIFNI
jgi:DNA helicase-2/ATP-dependent DNA helicase PcrA